LQYWLAWSRLSELEGQLQQSVSPSLEENCPDPQPGQGLWALLGPLPVIVPALPAVPAVHATQLVPSHFPYAPALPQVIVHGQLSELAMVLP